MTDVRRPTGPLNRERYEWRQVIALDLQRSAGVEFPEARSAFVKGACGSGHELRERVDYLTQLLETALLPDDVTTNRAQPQMASRSTT